MTATEFPVESPEDRPSADVLELLSDGENTWTAVPADVSGDDCLTHWITVDRDVLCDLEEMR